jgi:isoleucyl-tRNA synthetase
MPFLTEEVYQRLVRPTDASAPASVHWCDYPQADEALIDRDLERDVALSLTVTSLARKLREDHKLKIRQPLPALTIISRDPVVRAAGERFRAAIALELNVKEIRFSADEAAFCALTVKPNLKVLGKRAGQKLKAIGAALSAWSFTEVNELESGKTITVEGEAIGKDDLLLTRAPVAGAITASLGAVTVALDTAVTQDLMREGLAREFISVIQQARKDAGLEVSDRIKLTWDSEDGEVVAALTTHAAFIADEVLAVEFKRDASAATAADLNGRPVRYSLKMA